jgi:PiT family inorganic phosphate transporter
VIAGGVIKIVVFIVIAPLLGMVIGFIISAIVILFVKKHTPFGIDKHFRRLQLVSAAAFSLGHGGNDAQTGGKLMSDGTKWVVASGRV